MIKKTCPKCRRSFPLGDARLDEHWNKWSFEPAYAYCPHCNERLEGVHLDSVDLARHLTMKNLLLAVAWLGLSAIGLVSGSLNYVAPAMIAGFGLWLARTSRLRDHRIVGWVLIVSSVGILYVLNYAAA